MFVNKKGEVGRGQGDLDIDVLSIQNFLNSSI